jgi:hypothetical protein
MKQLQSLSRLTSHYKICTCICCTSMCMQRGHRSLNQSERCIATEIWCPHLAEWLQCVLCDPLVIIPRNTPLHHVHIGQTKLVQLLNQVPAGTTSTSATNIQWRTAGVFWGCGSSRRDCASLMQLQPHQLRLIQLHVFDKRQTRDRQETDKRQTSTHMKVA